MHRKVVIGLTVLVVIVLIIVIVVPVALLTDNDDSPPDPETAKTAAAVAPDNCQHVVEGKRPPSTEKECFAVGCIYDKRHKPPCYRLEMKEKFTYTNMSSTDEGFKGVLASDTKNRWLLSVEYIDDNILRFSMNSQANDRYMVPVPLNLHRKKTKNPQYRFIVDEKKDEFAFQIKRTSTGVAVWNLETDWNGLILTDQLLQITTHLPSTNVYGLGEQRHDSFKHKMDVTWPAFSRDQSPSSDDVANLYGVHPFYTCVEDKNGNTYGVLLWNSNAQEYAFSEKPSLTYRTIGGILDFYVFMGPTPEEVIQQYTQVIGRPAMPPYWALGFQLSRYGYNNIDNLKKAVTSTADFDIPQDVQYVDIDHMDVRKDFTIDKDKFPGLNDYFKSLQEKGMRIIYVLDPTLVSSKDYEPYRLMKEAKGAITWASDIPPYGRTNDSNGFLLGYTWPNETVIFPDFFKSSTKDVWKKLIKDHRNQLTFDGLWIDMNEPANFGTNDPRPWNWPELRLPYFKLTCPRNDLEDPFYKTKAVYRWSQGSRVARLSDKTICMSTVQGENNEYKHYDVHSLYGWSQTKPTLEAAQEATGERSVVISRSTFPGSGQWAGHWLGDNRSEWPDLHRSIIGMLEFNLFGIPYVGADICGFFGNTTPGLCKRWMQLGAFYPFCRNHNGIDNKDQGPGQLGNEVAKASSDILKIRYRLLPYLYTLFHQAHTLGSTVVRSMHHVFPTDPDALAVDKQFMWGSCLMIIPILEENPPKVKFFVPAGSWYSYIRSTVTHSTYGTSSYERTSDVTSEPIVWARGGCVIFEQDPAKNTKTSRNNPFNLFVAMDVNQAADGTLFWDDGVSIDTYETGAYFSAKVEVRNTSLDVTVTHQAKSDPQWQSTMRLKKIAVYGIGDDDVKKISKVSLNVGQTVTDVNFQIKHDVLTIDLGDSTRLENLKITWA